MSLKKQYMPCCVKIQVGARGSSLSKAQVEEVLRELRQFHPEVEFDPSWLKTKGDLDLKTSLKMLDKSDFFTKEIDELQLQGVFRISIHSAKDLPEPLARGLEVVALTKGVDPSDALVFRDGMSLDLLPKGARIGVSSARREEAIFALRDDLVCIDIRGPIDQRLALLDEGVYDAVVIAEAALIRLKLTCRHRLMLNDNTAPLQGRLAVVARENDHEMKELFSCIHHKSGCCT